MRKIGLAVVLLAALFIAIFPIVFSLQDTDTQALDHPWTSGHWLSEQGRRLNGRGGGGRGPGRGGGGRGGGGRGRGHHHGGGGDDGGKLNLCVHPRLVRTLKLYHCG
ncbi:hypothetical protein M758_9G080600 [Ceratodon purpureus]|nr:hypothetical protein M758_9G080600 [Ceratodon purpureus]